MKLRAMPVLVVGPGTARMLERLAPGVPVLVAEPLPVEHRVVLDQVERLEALRKAVPEAPISRRPTFGR